MKYIVLALALCFALSPLEAASKPANTHAVKPKKSKIKAHKPPKARSHARTRAH
jgi:hypothetical protein